MKVDFSKFAKEYRKYRPTYPSELAKRLTAWTLQEIEGTALEVGCGAGQFTQLIMKEKLNITALDISTQMLDEALDFLGDNAKQIEFLAGDFCTYDFSSRSFDWIFIAQAWHLLDKMKAARMCHDVLSESGKLVLVYNSRLEELSKVVKTTNELIRHYNSEWVHDGYQGFYPDYLVNLREAGFLNLEAHSFDWEISYSLDNWIGRILASKGVGASMSPSLIEPFLATLRKELLPLFQASSLIAVPHRIFFIVAEK
jgi:SAM-dependent methyltransferase